MNHTRFSTLPGFLLVLAVMALPATSCVTGGDDDFSGESIGDREQEVAVLSWAKLLWGSSKDDVPHGSAISGDRLYMIGTQYDDFFGVSKGKQKFRITSHAISSGNGIETQTAQCKEGFPNILDYAHGEDIAAYGGSLYAVGHFRCKKVCFSLGGHNTTCQSGEVHGDALLLKLDRDLRPRWSESLQSDNEDKAESVVVAPDGGSVYVAGHYKGSHLKLKGATYLQNRGGFDIFVARYTSSGQPTGQVIGIGGADDDGQAALARDSAGNVYVTGYMRSSPAYIYKRNLSTGQTVILGRLDRVGGGSDAFVVKLSPSLNLRWAKVFGGSGDDKGVSIATRGSDVFVGGFLTGSMNLPGCCTVSGHGGKDGFAVRVSSSGHLDGGIALGSSGTDEVASVRVSPSTGRIFVAGFFGGSMTVGPYHLAPIGGRDAFLVEVDRNGTIYWSGSAGGTGADEATTVATANGVVTVGGYFDSNPMYVGSQSIYKSGGGQDAWFLRLNNGY